MRIHRACRRAENVAREGGTSGEDSYFPERALARFLSRTDEGIKIYAFEKRGVQPVRVGYQLLVNRLELDAIVLIDGGTDILLRGDEAGLGTPEEDMTSLAAVAGIPVATRIVACVGFGIDTFHGVCHANWLENVGALTRSGAFLGAMALLEPMPEVQSYIDAVDAGDMATPRRPSIVNGSIVSAINGYFGDFHRTSRTSGSQLFINPLMTLLWCFDLEGVARRNLYLGLLEDTETIWQVQSTIAMFRETVKWRPRTLIPH